MIKTILAPLLGDGTDENVLTFANAVAEQFHGHIDALHVSHDPVDEVLRLTIGGGVITRELWSGVERDIQARHDRAQKSFQQFCNIKSIPIKNVPEAPTAGVTASWKEVEGDLATEVGLQGRFHELIVADRGDANSGFSPRELGDILVRSGRPMLICSREHAAPKTFETVAVAWKDTLEAAHMLTAAMPMIEAASRVVILIASENDDSSADADCVKYLAAELSWHGVEPEVRCLPSGDGAAEMTLIDAATKASADLLILGGYGHSRALEYVFGGVTRYMLESAKFPVFIVH